VPRRRGLRLRTLTDFGGEWYSVRVRFFMQLEGARHTGGRRGKENESPWKRRQCYSERGEGI